MLNGPPANATTVSARKGGDGIDEWTRIVIKAGKALLSFKVDSWQNGVNRSSGCPGDGAENAIRVWRGGT